MFHIGTIVIRDLTTIHVAHQRVVVIFGFTSFQASSNQNNAQSASSPSTLMSVVGTPFLLWSAEQLNFKDDSFQTNDRVALLGICAHGFNVLFFACPF